jgi:hypothetical protein
VNIGKLSTVSLFVAHVQMAGIMVFDDSVFRGVMSV